MYFGWWRAGFEGFWLQYLEKTILTCLWKYKWAINFSKFAKVSHDSTMEFFVSAPWNFSAGYVRTIKMENVLHSVWKIVIKSHYHYVLQECAIIGKVFMRKEF